MKRNSPILLRKLGARLFSNSPPILSPLPWLSPSPSLTTVSDRDVIYSLCRSPSRSWMIPLINRSSALRNLRWRLYNYLYSYSNSVNDYLWRETPSPWIDKASSWIIALRNLPRRLYYYLYSDSNSVNDYRWRETPSPWIDKASSWIIHTLLYPTKLLLQRYGCRVVMLETLVAVPGTVANLLRHLHPTIQQMELGGDWTKTLLQEAGKESLQLKNFMEGFNFKPMLYERAVVHAVQAVFFNIYMLSYLFCPRMAHGMVGHLKEYAVHSYTEFLKAIAANRIGNAPAPAIAIDYWRLGLNATLRDVVMVIRAEEAYYRDMNQFERWMAEHGRGYRDAAAKQHRFKIFEKKLRNFESLYGRSLQLGEGLNMFADLTREEFGDTYCGHTSRPHRVQFEILL